MRRGRGKKDDQSVTRGDNKEREALETREQWHSIRFPQVDMTNSFDEEFHVLLERKKLLFLFCSREKFHEI